MFPPSVPKDIRLDRFTCIGGVGGGAYEPVPEVKDGEKALAFSFPQGVTTSAVLNDMFG